MAEIPIRVDNLPVQEALSGTSRPLIVDASGTVLVQGPEYVVDGLKDVDAATPGDGQRLAFDEVLRKWVPKRSTSALGMVAFPYEYKTGESLTPGGGNVTTDNATLNLSTIIYVNKVNKDNEDISLFLNNIQVGTWLNMLDRDDADRFVAFDVIAAPTVVGDIYQVPVVFHLEDGAPFVDKLKIALFLRFTGELTQVPAGGLTGQVLTKLSNDDYDVGWATP